VNTAIRSVSGPLAASICYRNRTDETSTEQSLATSESKSVTELLQAWRGRRGGLEAVIPSTVRNHIGLNGIGRGRADLRRARTARSCSVQSIIPSHIELFDQEQAWKARNYGYATTRICSWRAPTVIADGILTAGSFKNTRPSSNPRWHASGIAIEQCGGGSGMYKRADGTGIPLLVLITVTCI
jgi:hypothetical protein